MARRFPKYSDLAMFSCLYNYLNMLTRAEPCFARMKNFLTSFSQHVGSGGGGCVFATGPPGFCRKVSFLSYQELITKRKEGRVPLHFVALGGCRRWQTTAADKEAWGAVRKCGGLRCPGHGMTMRGPSGKHKKRRPPYDGRPDVQRRGGPTGPDPPARGSLPDLPGTCPDVPSGRAR